MYGEVFGLEPLKTDEKIIRFSIHFKTEDHQKIAVFNGFRFNSETGEILPVTMKLGMKGRAGGWITISDLYSFGETAIRTAIERLLPRTREVWARDLASKDKAYLGKQESEVFIGEKRTDLYKEESDD